MHRGVFLVVVLLILVSCAKEENYVSSIPYSVVKIDIQTQIQNNFDNPFYSQEYTEKGYSGYGGVIAISNADASYIYAFDMCCPYESPAINRVIKQGTTALKVRCPKCGSVYNIADGTGAVVSGPSTEKLKSYRVLRDGYYYRIRN